MKNRGAHALGRTGKSQTDIAAEVGVSIPTVHAWLRSEKRPAAGARRDRLFELYAIVQSWWDEPVSAARAARPIAPATPAADNALAVGGAFAMARRLQSLTERELAAVEALALDADEKTAPLERIRRMTQLGILLEKLMKMTGEHDLGRHMMQTPIWQRIKAELDAVLRKHPEAAREVGERFAKLDAETSG